MKARHAHQDKVVLHLAAKHFARDKARVFLNKYYDRSNLESEESLDSIDVADITLKIGDRRVMQFPSMIGLSIEGEHL